MDGDVEQRVTGLAHVGKRLMIEDVAERPALEAGWASGAADIRGSGVGIDDSRSLADEDAVGRAFDQPPGVFVERVHEY
jgi:hypothetical protein